MMQKKNDWNPKIIAMYLPQFHEISENNTWWGKGFTDWVSVKQAEPLYVGHCQPKVPLNNNYYDLSQKESIKWQYDLAQKYGIDGFCIYHYWFANGKKLLEKPAEIILENKDINMPFCFAWDNISWVRTWSKIQGNAWTPQKDNYVNRREENGLLLELDYGDESDWEKHFNYLLPFFSDKRYIKKEGKPVFIFFTNYDKENLIKMGKYWNQLAKEQGMPGIYLITRSTPFNRNKLFDATLRYEPIYSGWQFKQILCVLLKLGKDSFINKKPLVYDYDKIWKKNIRTTKLHQDDYYGAFVNYDDTPRRGNNGKVILGSTPNKFGKYLSQLCSICQKQNKEFLFLTAWNEWGEGAYLEPDSINNYSYIEQIKKIKGV